VSEARQTVDSPGAASPPGGTVLLVEDEENIGGLVRTYLKREGYQVVWVRTGAEGLAELARHPVRIIVLDIGLPDVDGFELCRRIRARSSTPILMLTARDEEADRVAGLELGADDYVAKPFSPRELVARLRAILRRVESPPGSDVLTLADVTVHRDGREVLVGDRPVQLTVKEFDLLAYLVENAGVVLSREQLLDRVWGMAYPGGTRTVDVHVAQLRRKLDRPRLIRTVRGAGYKAVRA
jgi:DNA-binding response OmpR family regulator